MQSASARLLNRSVRALAQTAGASEWKELLLDSAARFCGRVALLRAGSQEFVLEGARGVEEQARVVILRAAAPALEEAVRTGETMAAAAAASELSHPVAQLFADHRQVFAIPVGGIAVMVASGVEDVAPLELLAGVAALALRRAPAPDLVPLPPPGRPPATRPKPDELRARHFARVAVARMLLRHSSAVAAGRRGRSLYSALAPVIDAAREQYSARFLTPGARLADYLHEELVGNLAGNDESVLGPEYPGPLA